MKLIIGVENPNLNRDKVTAGMMHYLQVIIEPQLEKEGITDSCDIYSFDSDEVIIEVPDMFNALRIAKKLGNVYGNMTFIKSFKID